MSTGLAASVWLTGCQNTALNRFAAHGTGSTPSVAKACPDGKDSLHADLNRSASDKTEKTARLTSHSKTPSAAAVPLCSTCAKCGASCGAAEPAAKGAPVSVAACDSC